MVQGGNHTPGSQKQQRFEKGVGEKMEGGGGECPGSDPQHHQADLAHGRIGQNSLQVPLKTGAGGSIQSGQSAGDCNRGTGNRRDPDQRKQAGQQINTGSDHCRGMNLGRNRRRASHGVRQPDGKRQLGRFAGRADQEQNPERSDHTRRHQKSHGVDLGDRFCAEELKHPDDGNPERGVADSGDDERLAAGRCVVRVPVPETDQPVGTETDPLPPQVQQRQVFSQHQHQHGKDKNIQQSEVAGIGRVILHIADRVEVNQSADKGDHQDQRQ